MTGASNLTLTETVDGWAEVTLKMLRLRIIKLGIGTYRMGKDWVKYADMFDDKISLYDSLKFEHKETGDSFQNIEFSYNIYGKFVDMGVGREFTKGNSGDVKSSRRRKEWFSRLFYAQVMRLSEIIKKQTGERAAKQMVAMIKAVNDLKYNEYRSTDLARNKSNYNKQILLPEDQRTWRKTL